MLMMMKVVNWYY